jgi:thioredoxin 1
MAQGIIKVDDNSFETVIANGTVLVDFYADWCGPCRVLSPILEALANEMQDKVTVVKLDVDQSPKVSQELQIRSIPTMILYKGGKEVNRIIGLKDLDTLRKLVS